MAGELPGAAPTSLSLTDSTPCLTASGTGFGAYTCMKKDQSDQLKEEQLGSLASKKQLCLHMLSTSFRGRTLRDYANEAPQVLVL